MGSLDPQTIRILSITAAVVVPSLLFIVWVLKDPIIGFILDQCFDREYRERHGFDD